MTDTVGNLKRRVEALAYQCEEQQRKIRRLQRLCRASKEIQRQNRILRAWRDSNIPTVEFRGYVR